ncbi:MAG: hypothetical protein MUD14_21475 [Hydrococcus sp. Prado102]|jgi:hypothetical protein|nr:hypothetical protein [Hydrococcus sp. Prado102]
MTVTVSIPVPERINNKVQGDFYPLQRQELLALKQAGIINNAAYVHMALRCDNPFCDRPIEIIPREFAQRWNLAESSLYEAIAKLKKLGILAIRTGKLLLNWILSNRQATSAPSADVTSDSGNDAKSTSKSQENIDTETLENNAFENSESLRDLRVDSEISEPILKSQNQFQNSKIDSNIPENRELESLPDKNCALPQTIQTYTNFKKTLSESERENFLNFVKEQIKNLPKQVNDIEAWLANQNKAGQNRWEVYYNNFLASQKVKNSSASKYQSLEEEIEQRRQEIKKRLREASPNLSSNVKDSCTLRKDEQNSSHSRHSDLQKEIERRREEAKKYWLEQRRQIARKRFEQGGES